MQKTEKCCENYLGSNVSDFKVTTGLSLNNSITANLQTQQKDHSRKILIGY